LPDPGSTGLHHAIITLPKLKISAQASAQAAGTGERGRMPDATNDVGIELGQEVGVRCHRISLLFDLIGSTYIPFAV
jgi:hypothetical protein